MFIYKYIKKTDLIIGLGAACEQSTKGVALSNSRFYTSSTLDIKSGLMYSNPSNSVWSIVAMTCLREGERGEGRGEGKVGGREGKGESGRESGR